MEPVELAQEPKAKLRHGRTTLRLLIFPVLLVYLELTLRLYMGLRPDYLPVALPFALSGGFLLAGLTAVFPRRGNGILFRLLVLLLCLVCAGELVMAEAEKYGAEIVPVDSEHSAIFQCLMGCGSRNEIRRLILTCSGGPFFGMTRAQLETVTKADALKHPNWKMGAKITIDCATLMNKGLEVIEAMRLYRLPLEQVDVVIHRQSIVHSMVEFTDGAVMAQMGTPDMRLPIQLALTYPERIPSPVERLDLLSCGPLTFSPPDTENFPCLALARDCAKAGGTACPAMNGANEEAVAMFLNDKIGFYDIYRLVNAAATQVPFVADPTLEQILEADRLAREAVWANS